MVRFPAESGILRSTRAIFPSSRATSICRLIWLAKSITCPPLRTVSYRGVSCAKADEADIAAPTSGVETNSLLFMTLYLLHEFGSEHVFVRVPAPTKVYTCLPHQRSLERAPGFPSRTAGRCSA